MAMPWPTPMHIETRAYLPPVRSSWRTAVSAMREPDAPSGCPSAIAPPFGLSRLSSRRELESLTAGEHLRCERLVDLDDVHVLEVEAGALQRLLRSRHRPEAHDARSDACDAGRDDARPRLSTGLVARIAARDEQRCCAVVDARGIAGCRHAVLEQRAQLGEAFHGRLEARMLVHVDRRV